MAWCPYKNRRELALFLPMVGRQPSPELNHPSNLDLGPPGSGTARNKSHATPCNGSLHWDSRLAPMSLLTCRAVGLVH